jgi:hypothetical protein
VSEHLSAVILVEGCYDVDRMAETEEVGENAGVRQETPSVADSLEAGRDIRAVQVGAEADGTAD